MTRAAGSWLCVVGLAGGLSGGVFAAQAGMDRPKMGLVQAQDAGQTQGQTQDKTLGKGIRTLHVYENLIQIPVLVLSPTLESIKPVAASRFRVSIDGGPPYRMTHVRLEGDDPISLAIFLDLHGSEDVLMSKMGRAIAELAPLSLHPRDHVSIYALDCGLLRSSNDVVADRAALEDSVDAILQAWMSRKREKHKRNCWGQRRIWDSLAFVTEKLSDAPGRRVILAVTDGDDKGSANKWSEVRTFAQAKGVAVFGLAYEPAYAAFVHHERTYGDEFDTLCELSGGMVMTSDSMDLPQRLVEFTKLLRGRYIVEFPRPFNATSGVHDLAISIYKSDDFIRPAGASVPMADPAVMADPTTVPLDPSLTPEQGTRRISPKP